MELSTIQLANYAKIIGGVVVMIMSMFGVIADKDMVAFLSFGILTVGSSIISFYSRYKKGDLTLAGVRK